MSLGPAPPMTNRTLGKRAQILGAVATSRSMPLRYANRERKTIVTRQCQVYVLYRKSHGLTCVARWLRAWFELFRHEGVGYDIDALPQLERGRILFALFKKLAT